MKTIKVQQKNFLIFYPKTHLRIDSAPPTPPNKDSDELSYHKINYNLASLGDPPDICWPSKQRRSVVKSICQGKEGH